MGDTFNFNGSIGQFIKEGNGYIEHYHAQSVSATQDTTQFNPHSQDTTQFNPHSHDTSEHAMDTVPSQLASQRAQCLMLALQQGGLLDNGLQPIGMSWAERGYLAQQIAFKLNIENQWVTFGKLWHCDASALRSGYNRAKDMPKMASFEEKIKAFL